MPAKKKQSYIWFINLSLIIRWIVCFAIVLLAIPFLTQMEFPMRSIGILIALVGVILAIISYDIELNRRMSKLQSSLKLVEYQDNILLELKNQNDKVNALIASQSDLLSKLTKDALQKHSAKDFN